MNQKQKLEIKAKVLVKFKEANHPYFIKSLDMTLVPLCTMDCIRIFEKLKELIEEPDNEPTLWSPIHYATINPKDMTVIMDAKPNQILVLIRGKTYKRPRGQTSVRADASNCNLKGKWPKEMGEYGKLWARTMKGSELG